MSVRPGGSVTVQAARAKNLNVKLFFTSQRANCCKWLMEHLKLDHSFTTLIFWLVKS